MRKIYAVFLAFTVSQVALAQQAFLPNSVVVLRVGSPDSANSSRSREAFLHEYDTATGNLIQTISIPYSGADKLTLTGTSSSEGMLKRSVNKAYLTLGGYDLGLGVSSPSATATNATRVIARVGSTGLVEIGTKLAAADMFPNGQIRSVVSSDGSGYWAAGGSNGTRYVAHGATTSKNLSATVTNQRTIGIFGNTLYVCHSSGTAISRVYQIGASLSSTDSAGATSLPGIPTTATITAADFYFADLSESVPGLDVLYIADEATGSGLIKFSLVGGTWVENGRVLATTLRGLTGERTATGVVLFGTRASGADLVKLYDDGGYNAGISGSFTLLANSAGNTAFRGVAFAPVNASLPLNTLNIGASITALGNLIRWSSTDERNISAYELQRSTNGADYARISGVSASKGNYDYLDNGATGTTYYRLRITSKDGATQFSRVIKLTAKQGGAFSVWPNPATGGQIAVKHGEVPRGGGSIGIFAPDGRQVMRMTVPAGAVQTSLDISTLPRGNYYLNMQDAGGKKSVSFRKE